MQYLLRKNTLNVEFRKNPCSHFSRQELARLRHGRESAVSVLAHPVGPDARRSAPIATTQKRSPAQWRVQPRRRGDPTETRTFETKDAAQRYARLEAVTFGTVKRELTVHASSLASALRDSWWAVIARICSGVYARLLRSVDSFVRSACPWRSGSLPGRPGAKGGNSDPNTGECAAARVRTGASTYGLIPSRPPGAGSAPGGTAATRHDMGMASARCPGLTVSGPAQPSFRARSSARRWV